MTRSASVENLRGHGLVRRELPPHVHVLAPLPREEEGELARRGSAPAEDPLQRERPEGRAVRAGEAPSRPSPSFSTSSSARSRSRPRAVRARGATARRGSLGRRQPPCLHARDRLSSSVVAERGHATGRRARGRPAEEPSERDAGGAVTVARGQPPPRSPAPRRSLRGPASGSPGRAPRGRGGSWSRRSRRRRRRRAAACRSPSSIRAASWLSANGVDAKSIPGFGVRAFSVGGSSLWWTA